MNVRPLLAAVLFLAILSVLGCGKEKVTGPPLPLPSPSIAIDTTGFDVAVTDTIRGTASNCPDSSVVVLFQRAQDVKSEVWSWRWWEISTTHDSVMTLNQQRRWAGVRQPCRCQLDSALVLLMLPENLAALPRVPVYSDELAAKVTRHALAFARMP